MYWIGQHVGPIGIDLGARRVRVLQLRQRSEGYEIVAAGGAELEPGAEQDSDVVRSKLAKVLAEQKFIGKCAVTSLPSSDVEVKSMRLPNMPEAELESAVALEARERFRDLGDDVVLRSIPVGRVGRAGDGRRKRGQEPFA